MIIKKVNKLRDAGFSSEVMNLDWFANIMLVKKAIGK